MMIIMPDVPRRWLHVAADGTEQWFDVEPSHVPTLTVWQTGSNFEETLTYNGRFTVEDWPRLPKCGSRIVRTRLRPRGNGWSFVEEDETSSRWRRRINETRRPGRQSRGAFEGGTAYSHCTRGGRHG